MLPSARFFLCALCRKQVVVCRRCDRGQIYCTETCSRQRRSERQHEAKTRYAKSRAGRHNNAERQRRFRARLFSHNPPILKIVTDQGSAPSSPADNLVLDQHEPIKHQPTDMRCHHCRQYCDPLLRSDFLPSTRRHPRYATTQHDTIP